MVLGLTKEDQLNEVYGGTGHVVILDAGASIVATNPYLNIMVSEKVKEATVKIIPTPF